MAGLYVHIPFCVKKCRYCDFVSFPGEAKAMAAYLHSLQQEIALWQEPFSDTTFDTVFFGGGTPSLLTGTQMAELMTLLRTSFSIAAHAEITTEANPGTVDEKKLAQYRQAGINRLSLGMQSASNQLLRRIGRIHTREEFIRAMTAASDAGFTNINADVMIGLPGQTGRDVQDALSLAAGLGCTHLSAYTLILEEGTPLYADVEQGREAVPDEDETADLWESALCWLAQNGFDRYEISNFAKPGCESRHNRNYWENGSYLGLGLAAHSACRRNGRWLRRENTAVLADYIRALEQGRPPVLQEEAIPLREEMFECVMLGLRMVRGMSLSAFERRFGVSALTCYAQQIRTAQSAGNLLVQDGYLRLTQRGMEIQNRVLLPFLEASEADGEA